jgi:UDP-2-acetamido-3-amino-2,3-dideoxy-glucuronate N-acetyltransferase
MFIHESSYVETKNIGTGTNVWHFCHIMKNATIGENCNIGQNVFIAEDVVIGNNCKIQNNVSLYKGLIIEDWVFIGPSAVFTNIKNPRAEINRKDKYLKTIIKEGATIGANATIVCGVVIGEYSFIGAGSVVTKDIPPYTIWYGNPAEFKGEATKNLIEFGEKVENIGV